MSDYQASNSKHYANAVLNDGVGDWMKYQLTTGANFSAYPNHNIIDRPPWSVVMTLGYDPTDTTDDNSTYVCPYHCADGSNYTTFLAGTFPSWLSDKTNYCGTKCSVTVNGVTTIIDH